MILATVGALLLAVVLWDILMSALGAGSAGPLAPRIAHGAFRLIRQLPDRDHVHRICGPLVTASIGAGWIVLMCVAWSLILSGAPEAVVTGAEGTPAGTLGRVSYAGHLLSTLGGGLNQPGTQAWGAVSMLIGVSGMVVLTLSVSFVYSTTQAVATGRAVLALSEIHGPGTERFDTVLLPELATLVAQIKAIPFCLYFSTARPHRRLPAALARLRCDARLDAEDRARLDVLLTELPGMEHAPADSFGTSFEDWVQRYSLRSWR